MTDGIHYDPLGTVDVTFDDQTYHLGRPKLKHFRHFAAEIEKVTKRTRDRLNELSKAVAEATNAIEAEADPVLAGTLEKANEEALAEDATVIDRQVQQQAWNDVYEAASDARKAEYDQARAELKAFSSTPFYETSSEVLREMFAQLGDRKLPDDLEDWPVWLATDTSIPAQILAHWRNVPKASGAEPPS